MNLAKSAALSIVAAILGALAIALLLLAGCAGRNNACPPRSGAATPGGSTTGTAPTCEVRK